MKGNQHFWYVACREEVLGWLQEFLAQRPCSVLTWQDYPEIPEPLPTTSDRSIDEVFEATRCSQFYLWPTAWGSPRLDWRPTEGGWTLSLMNCDPYVEISLSNNYVEDGIRLLTWFTIGVSRDYFQVRPDGSRVLCETPERVYAFYGELVAKIKPMLNRRKVANTQKWISDRAYELILSGRARF